MNFKIFAIFLVALIGMICSVAAQYGYGGEYLFSNFD